MPAENAIDIISSLIDYGGVWGGLVKEWWSKKMFESREIYISEVRNGIFDNIDMDDTLSICHRLYRAISEGTAKKNFRLICRLVQGLGDNHNLTAPTFLKFANILDSLSDEEIKIMAYDIWLYYNPKPKPERIVWQCDTPDYVIEAEQKRYKEETSEWNAKHSEIKKHISFNKEQTEQIHYSLLRTGLYTLDIIPEGEIVHHEAEYKGPGEHWEFVDAGVVKNFSFTDLMFELIKYVDITVNL